MVGLAAAAAPVLGLALEAWALGYRCAGPEVGAATAPERAAEEAPEDEIEAVIGAAPGGQAAGVGQRCRR